ncbi:MAG: UDP-2,3-diacylglucosamine diphosphatase [Gammaproteobacteria bacterium]
MNRYFISDLHLDESKPKTTKLFHTFIKQIIKENINDTEVYILGDLFESWIGDDYDNPFHDEIKLLLTSMSNSGVKVFFLFGNRDFLIGETFLSKTGIELLDDPALLTINEKRVLITHGDQMCLDDRDYQNFRAMVRNPEWQQEFLSFPISKRLKIAGEAKDASKQSKQEKVIEIMDVNEKAVAAIFNEHQIDLMIHGHTHRPMKHEIVLDGKTYYRYVLGDWAKDSAIIIDWSNDSPQFIDLIN